MKLLLAVFSAVLLCDLVWLNLTLLSKPSPSFLPLPSPIPSPFPDFQNQINQLNSRFDLLEKIPTATPPSSVIQKTKSSSQVAYVPIPGSGSTLSNTWASLPGTEFYFNQADFPNLKEAYFEANFNLLNGNGQAFLRLFDVTHGVEIWNSEISAIGQSSVAVVSSKIILRPGNNLLRVQAKSLTADTAIFHSGRLKLIIPN